MELMDGENKISCDVCNEKKATNRATCFDDLPNSFIIHLKRFELDFATWETKKLNSKLEFPILLNMYKFTKLGREAAEEAREPNKEGKGGEVPVELEQELGTIIDVGTVDTTDFDYELQGVLVHTGIAQGGHYYSYAKGDSATAGEQWYRFDDDEGNSLLIYICNFHVLNHLLLNYICKLHWNFDDNDEVTEFLPENIAEECFGGEASSYPATGAANFSGKKIERMSNALMLFYK